MTGREASQRRVMSVPARGRVIGLTGGVASGKSTVARMFADLGAKVVDADALARQVVEPRRVAYREIVRSFGPEILGADGRIDRQKLGAKVFAEPAARQRLNAITHPRIQRAAQRAIRAYLREGARVVLYEAALLVENEVHRQLEGLIVVSLSPELQLARLMARDGLSRQAALGRIRSQLPLEAKLAVADYVIDCSGSLSQTRRQTRKVWQALLAERVAATRDNGSRRSRPGRSDIERLA